MPTNLPVGPDRLALVRKQRREMFETISLFVIAIVATLLLAWHFFVVKVDKDAYWAGPSPYAGGYRTVHFGAQPSR
jgi:hypothetical protein